MASYYSVSEAPFRIPPGTTHVEIEVNHPIRTGDIPNSVTNLILRSFNHPLLPNALPKSITHLTFGLFDRDLAVGSIPDSVTHLTFGILFNRYISPGAIPNSVVELVFGDRYDRELVVGSIPDSVRTLVFGTMFKQQILPGILPEYITHIVFGEEFDQDISPGALPKNLKKLVFTGVFDRTFSPGDLPDALEHLTLGYRYDSDIERGSLPDSLTELVFGDSFNRPLRPNTLPSNLKHLTFGGMFNRPIRPGVLPHKLTNLTFGDNYEMPIQRGALPKSLTHLTFGYTFNNAIRADVLPKSLTHLEFGASFNEEIEEGALPRNLTHLTFGQYFNQHVYPGMIPKKVTHLTLGASFNEELERGSLPPRLVYLDLGGYYKPISRGVIPASVTTIIVDYKYYRDNDEESFRNILPHLPPVQADWYRATDMFNDSSVSLDRKLELLRELYLKGYPIPVEPHPDSTLTSENIPQSILTHYSIERGLHKDYHSQLPDNMKKLIDRWIYGDYSSFNRFISNYNNGIPDGYNDKRFLGGFPDALQAYRSMREVIMNAPRRDNPVFAWRGLHGLDEFCANVTEGSYVGFSRFMACSVAQEVSCGFARDGLLLLIELPKKSPLFNLTYVKRSEPEFLLPDRMVFRVVKRFPYDLCKEMNCDELIHIKLVGTYTQDKLSFEEYFDVDNPEEIRIDKVY
jgi:hypothetical protein